MHLDRLLSKEQHDAAAEEAAASANADRTTWLLVSVAGAGLILGLLLLLYGIRRVRRELEPGEEQAEFAVTLQIASDEDEANRLLQRHLERSVPPTAAVVLNRNNSADRLESATPLPSGSPLANTLRGAAHCPARPRLRRPQRRGGVRHLAARYSHPGGAQHR